MEILQKVQRFSRWTSIFYELFGVIRYIVPYFFYKNSEKFSLLTIPGALFI